MAASGTAEAAGYAVQNARIASVHMESGIAYLRFDEPIDNPDGCAGTDWVVLAGDLSNREGYLGLTLTALGAGRSISVYVSGCVSSPWGASLPKVYALTVGS